MFNLIWSLIFGSQEKPRLESVEFTPDEVNDFYELFYGDLPRHRENMRQSPPGNFPPGFTDAPSGYFYCLKTRMFVDDHDEYLKNPDTAYSGGIYYHRVLMDCSTWKVVAQAT